MTKNITESPREKLEKLKASSPRSKKNVNQASPTSIKGLPKGWTRATVLVRLEHLKKLKTIAFMGQTTLKDVLERIIQNFLANKNVRTTPDKTLDQVLESLDKNSEAQ